MNTDPLLTPEQAAGYLALPVSTLTFWRHSGRGPEHIRAGRLVRYRQSALDKWIDAQTVTGWR